MDLKQEKIERIDDLQHNNLKLIQYPEDFCFGCDSVELANFVSKSKIVCKACDLGAGNGIISVLLASKKNMNVTAVEIQESAAKLCERNAVLNGLENRITVENMAMQAMNEKYAKGHFDVVVSNPPYSIYDGGKTATNESKAIARHEIKVTLSEVISTAAYLLKFGGKFYIVSQSHRLAETIAICSMNLLEPKELQILRPKDDKPPHLFLLSCTANGKKGIKILPERVINAFSV